MRTVSDAIVTRLREWGLTRAFGYPGDGINGLIAAIQRADNKPRFVQPRHEESAAFMACAHAKLTGEVGLCIATSGPGAIHLLNGLYDAKLDHQPVVAIVGQTKRSALGGSYQQEVDLLSLFKDVAHEYVHMVVAPAQVPMTVDRAVRIALDRRTVTCLILPADVQEDEALDHVPHEHHFVPGGLGYEAPRVLPADDALDRAAQVLNETERCAILIGAGARDAADEVVAVADVLQGGVAKALLGKDILPDDLPFVTGSIGLLGTKPSYDMMRGCDALLTIGSSFPYSEFLPEPGKARGVQIDVDGTMIGIRYPMEVNLVGDSRETLRALLPRLKRKPRGAFREKLEKGIEEWWKVVEARALDDGDPINPQRVFWELSPRLPERSIVTCDSGTSAIWWARDMKLRKGMRGNVSGGLASMGCGVPYALAAKMAFPDRCVVACVGDGAMQMLGMNEMISIARYAHEWEDPRLIVLVVNNRDLNMVTWEMRMGGDPKFEESQALPSFDFAAFAEVCGLVGIRMRTPADVVPGIERAFAADRPCIIDAHVDGRVPPLPPHIEPGALKKLVGALLKGDVDAGEIVRRSFEQTLDGLRPKKA